MMTYSPRIQRRSLCLCGIRSLVVMLLCPISVLLAGKPAQFVLHDAPGKDIDMMSGIARAKQGAAHGKLVADFQELVENAVNVSSAILVDNPTNNFARIDNISEVQDNDEGNTSGRIEGENIYRRVRNVDKTVESTLSIYREHMKFVKGKTAGISNSASNMHTIITEDEKYYESCRHSSMNNPFVYHAVLEPINPCPLTTLILITVFSRPEDAARRQTYRQVVNFTSMGNRWRTDDWLSRYKLIFLLAMPSSPSSALSAALEQESQQHDDIVQYNFIDSYSALILKSLACLHFIEKHCLHVPYWLKQDSDTFVHLPRLLHIVNIMEQLDIMNKKKQLKTRLKRSVFGWLIENGMVLRHAKKWAVPRNVFPLDYYPPYAMGLCYIVSTDMVSELFAQAQRMSWLDVEDAFINGILVRIVGGQHLSVHGHIQSPYNAGHTNNSCLVFGDNTFVVTKLKREEQFLSLHNHLVTGVC